MNYRTLHSLICHEKHGKHAKLAIKEHLSVKCPILAFKIGKLCKENGCKSVDTFEKTSFQIISNLLQWCKNCVTVKIFMNLAVYTNT